MPYQILIVITAMLPCISRRGKAVLIAAMLSAATLIIKEIIRHILFMPDKKERAARAAARQADKIASIIGHQQTDEAKTHLSDEIAAITAKKAAHEARLAAIGGLADKDKSSKMAEAILSYFEQSKISSTEEGLARYAEQNHHDDANTPSDPPCAFDT